MFLVTFSYIWLSAFYNDPDYNDYMPTDPVEYSIVAKKNTWQGIYSVVMFQCAFAYLHSYVETVQNHWMQRINRVVVCLTLLYTSWIIYLLN